MKSSSTLAELNVLRAKYEENVRRPGQFPIDGQPARSVAGCSLCSVSDAATKRTAADPASYRMTDGRSAKSSLIKHASRLINPNITKKREL